MAVAEIDDRMRPTLARGARLAIDKATAQPVLLFPEGVVHLSPTAHAILALCDSKNSVRAILLSLCKEYDATEADLQSDVLECLEDLRRRKLLVFC